MTSGDEVFIIALSVMILAMIAALFMGLNDKDDD